MASITIKAGTVTTPVQGVDGAAKCHVLSGDLTLCRPATAAEAIAWAFSLCTTKAELESVMDSCETAGVNAEKRIGTPTVPTPAPAPVAKPVPATAAKAATELTGMQLSMLEGLPQYRQGTAAYKSGLRSRMLAEVANGTVSWKAFVATLSPDAPKAKTDTPKVETPAAPAPQTKDKAALLAELKSLGGNAGLAKGWGVEAIQANIAKRKAAKTTAPQESKPAPATVTAMAANPNVSGKTASTTPIKPADPVVPGCFGPAGKPLTLSQVMACLDKVGKAKAA